MERLRNIFKREQTTQRVMVDDVEQALLLAKKSSAPVEIILKGPPPPVEEQQAELELPSDNVSPHPEAREKTPGHVDAETSSHIFTIPENADREEADRMIAQFLNKPVRKPSQPEQREPLPKLRGGTIFRHILGQSLSPSRR